MPIVRATEQQSERYHRLIIQIGDLAQHARGWKLAVADLLGIDPTYVTKILGLKGRQRVGVDQVKRAERVLRLDDRFFHDDSPPQFLDCMAVRPCPETLDVLLRISDTNPITTISVDDAPEFDAMHALCALDDATRERVLAWARAKWRSER